MLKNSPKAPVLREGGGRRFSSTSSPIILATFMREPPTDRDIGGIFLTAAVIRVYPCELPEDWCAWLLGWSDGAIPKLEMIWLEAGRQGAFHLGQNANPLQVSVSGQPTKHRKCLRERDVLGSTAVPRRGGAGSRGTWRGGRAQRWSSPVPASKHTLILFHRQALFWLQLKPSYSDSSPVYSTDKLQKTKQGLGSEFSFCVWMEEDFCWGSQWFLIQKDAFCCFFLELAQSGQLTALKGGLRITNPFWPLKQYPTDAPWILSPLLTENFTKIKFSKQGCGCEAGWSQDWDGKAQSSANGWSPPSPWYTHILCERELHISGQPFPPKGQLFRKKESI